MKNHPETEKHPLEPFLPEKAKILMLGSFPPKRERWSMEFFYPNFNNDMWRIAGLAFFSDKDHFVLKAADGKPLKKFDREKIVRFCEEKGIALYDTASQVRRLKDNASDKFLEIVVPTDIPALLRRIPECHTVVVTGEKAAETVLLSLTDGSHSVPRIGTCEKFEFGGRTMHLYRMPSSSRAYPLALEKKAAFYGNMFSETGLL